MKTLTPVAVNQKSVVKTPTVFELKQEIEELKNELKKAQEAIPKKIVNGQVKTTQQITYETQVRTDKNGVATIYLTDNGKIDGKAIFTQIHNILPSAQFNTTDATQVRMTGVKAQSADNKRVDINVPKGKFDLLGLSSTMEMSKDGILVYVTVTGE